MNFPAFEPMQCDVHGHTVHMRRTASSPWTCGACIEDQSTARFRESVPVDPAVRAGAAGVPVTLASSRWSEIEPAVAAKAKVWLDGVEKSRGGLLVLGNVGVGKSYLAAAIMRELVARNIACLMTPAYHFLREFRRAWDAKDGQEQHVWNRHIEPTVLILDDVGSGRATDQDKERISELVSDRYDAGRPTVVTSNLTPEGIKAELGERAFSRLGHDGVAIKMAGADRRKTREAA